MGLNVVMVIVGLIICFGGIYLRRICSGILGLLCGVIGAFAFALATVGIWSIDESGTLIAVVICGVICAIISVIYYKACAAISSFLSSFSIVAILLATIGEMDSGIGIIIIAAIVSLIVSGISVKFYDYSFIIASAVVGAFIASVGGIGLINGDDLEDMLYEMIWGYDDFLAPILIATVILAVIGFCVQLRRLKLIHSTAIGSSQSSGNDSYQTVRTGASVLEQAGKAGVAAPPAFQANQAPASTASTATSAKPAAVFCPDCGEKVKSGVLFCDKCGHRLN